MVTSVNERIREFMREIFPMYELVGFEQISWRFCESRVQDLHLDSYKRSDDYWTVRALINVDSVPRIWCTSHGLEMLAESHYRRLDMNRFANASPDAFIKAFSDMLFGGVPNAGRDGFPRHFAHFPPQTLWLAKTRLIPHQIFYGRRMISAGFMAKASTMLDPSRCFSQRVKRIHERYA